MDNSSSSSSSSDDDTNLNNLEVLRRRRLVEELIECLSVPLPSSFERLTSAQPWLLYWIVHSLSMLEQTQFIETISQDVIKFVAECAHPDGGYGGGPGQIAHLATSYAAVSTLVTLSTEEALDSIDRMNLVKFLRRMKQPDGSFSLHDDGEIDSRATYCALIILKLLNVHDNSLLDNVADWILSCQTYEGGFGSTPGNEAHGGYTFCCVASLTLLNQLHRADMRSLLRWLTNKQMKHEGGFCGRSNKLVDSCYSYWQGSVFPLLHPYLKDLKAFEGSSTAASSSSEHLSGDLGHQTKPQTEEETEKSSNDQTGTRRVTRSQSQDTAKDKDSKERTSKALDALLKEWIFDCAALQKYVLNKCQTKDGLLRDKPGEDPDYYHTCYALSGLSISQHQPDGSLFDVVDKPINLLAVTHPVFNVEPKCLEFCRNYFENKKIEVLIEEGHPEEADEAS